MSTRRAGDFQFDHGAQYFTVESEAFRSFLLSPKMSDSVANWPVTINNSEDQRDRYVGMPGMNALCKALAMHLDVNFSVRVEQCIASSRGWELLTDSQDSLGIFDWVISTAPQPQTADLLPEIFSGHEDLQDVRMSGGFTVMAGFEEEISLPTDAAKYQGQPVGWVARNDLKPGRQTPPSLVIQASSGWADNHLEEDLTAVQAALLKNASELSGKDMSAAVHLDCHRWRYAQASTALGQDYLLDRENRLAVCGDWCRGAVVEDAFLSAHALAGRMIEVL